MTKEEAIDILRKMSEDNFYGNHVHEACKMGIEALSQLSIPRWFLEVVENTLRIQNNINLDKKTEETCQDRNIRQSLNGVRKLLNGEELTGMERFEKLQPSFPSNLDKVAEEYANKEFPDEPSCGQFGTGDYEPPVDRSFLREIAKDSFKAGAGCMAGQGYTKEGIARPDDCEIWVNFTNADIKDGDKVIVQIRKKK